MGVSIRVSALFMSSSVRMPTPINMKEAVGHHNTTDGIVHLPGCSKLELQVPGYEKGRRNNPVIVNDGGVQTFRRLQILPLWVCIEPVVFYRPGRLLPTKMWR
jgi:hypothetical protein